MTRQESTLHPDNVDHGWFSERARSRWNARADQFNQWDVLGQDEKDELIDQEQQLFEREKPNTG